ncbi:MAG: MMPL family transporter, partial [Pseudomonadales bacterium]|nr:MMPL family transporter [Pseudomonadales bacterium]
TDFGVVPLALPLTGDEGDTGLDTEGETDFLSADDMLLGGELVVDESISVEEIEYADMQMAEYLDFMTALRAVADLPEFSGFRFYYTGNAPMMEFALNNMKQASVLLLFMIFIVVGLLWFLFRSLSAVVWPIVVIAGSAFWTIGAASWMGVTLSNMVTLTFMLILAVGIADCVHVLSSYIFFRHRHEHREAIQMAFRKTGLPIFLTTITTMAGMSALMVSDIPQIGVFGVTSAIGVGVAFILTILVFPVLLDVWHPKVREDTAQPVRKHAHWLQPLLNRIPDWVAKRAKTIVIVYLGIFLMFVVGAANVKVDSNFAELTKEGSEIRVTYSIVDESMMGGQNMEVLLQFGQRNALKDPVVLQAVDDFQRFIEAEYDHYVVKTFSLADFVKDTNKIMNGGNPTFERIPEDERLAAQLIYLFDNANPVDRRNLVADDYSKSHISIQLRNAGSYEYTQFFDEIKGDVKRFFNPLTDRYPEAQYSVTGSLALMMELIDHISWTQIKSFSFALLIITVLMMLTLGSVQAGLISMVPNLLPAFFTFGLMGLLGIPLDTDTLIIAPLIIGIAVDDTIHFVAHYRDAWFASGDVHQALESTIKEVGQAVTFTTLILGVGFSMLAFSDYLGLAKTGIFGSMAIFVALSSDLLLLPALIKWVKPDLGRKKYLASTAQVAI